ncbi:MAG TPA: hypothetical protein VFF33_11965 [Ignavibacteriaceae bacterium]|nr:hypothetical protein [Ignavibacteriaceae bacterium]
MKKLFFLGYFLFLSSLTFSQMLPWKNITPLNYSYPYDAKADTASKRFFIGDQNKNFFRINSIGDSIDILHLTSELYSVIRVDEKLYSVAYQGRGVFESLDNGLTWREKYDIFRAQNLYYDGQRIWSGTEDGRIFYFDKQGNLIWLNGTLSGRIKNIYCFDNILLAGVEYKGNYRSSDMGIT